MREGDESRSGSIDATAAAAAELRSTDGAGRPPLPPSGTTAGGGSGGLADVVEAARNYDDSVKGKAAELAGMLQGVSGEQQAT